MQHPRILLLSLADSNHYKQNQNLLCYHYTKGQSRYSAAKVVLFLSTTKYFRKILISPSAGNSSSFPSVQAGIYRR